MELEETLSKRIPQVPHTQPVTDLSFLPDTLKFHLIVLKDCFKVLR